MDPLGTTIAAQLVQCDATGTSTELVQCDLCDLVGTINVVFYYAAFFLVGLTVIMLLVGGIKYLVATGSSAQIESAKKTVQFAIIGLVIVILAFVIVGSILDILGYKEDPFSQVACEVPTSSGGGTGTSEPTTPPSPRPGQEPTGPGASGQWSKEINAAAKKYNLEPCALQSVVQRESAGDPKAVGHDAHSPSSDPPNGIPPKHGLNWNYSHGIGLTQVTIFPEKRFDGWRDSNTPSRKIGSTFYTVDDLYNPETNLDAGAYYLSNVCLKKCNGDYQCAFGCYNGAGTNSEYAESVNRAYEQCKQEGQSQGEAK